MDFSVTRNTPIKNVKIVNHKGTAESSHFRKTTPDSFRLSHVSVPAGNSPFLKLNDEILASTFPRALISKYGTEEFLNKTLEANPRIGEILDEAGIPRKVYIKNISNGTESHFMPTLKTAFGIMKNCDMEFSKNDYAAMAQASVLHDIGKAFIPEEILNKPGMLTAAERKIVDNHATLGYEALKAGGVSPRVLNLVKNHHTYNALSNMHTDYPHEQILQISDIWSALKEKRCYKEAFSDAKAFEILYQRAQKGEFEAKFVDALKKFIKSAA